MALRQVSARTTESVVGALTLIAPHQPRWPETTAGLVAAARVAVPVERRRKETLGGLRSTEAQEAAVAAPVLSVAQVLELQEALAARALP